MNTIVPCFTSINHKCTSHYVCIKHRNTAHQQVEKYPFVKTLSKDDFIRLVNNGSYDIVILHNIRSLPLSLIPSIPNRIKVVWLAWGFDLYGSIGPAPFIQIPNLYHCQTSNLLRPTSSESLEHLIKIVYKNVIKKTVEKAINRVDYFSGVIPEEYELMTHVPFFRAKKIDFRYASPQRVIDRSSLDEMLITGSDIMVGNSGDPSNNHADVFCLLRDLDLGDRKIYVPLSYAGSLRYKKLIVDFGRECFGDRMVVLDRFLPVDEYKKAISTCYYRIFGHERQQAIGNINMAFRNGCRVFMYENSMNYKYYHRMGLKFYCLNSDMQNELLRSPDFEEDRKNRSIIIDDMLTTKQIDRLNRFIDSIE